MDDETLPQAAALPQVGDEISVAGRTIEVRGVSREMASGAVAVMDAGGIWYPLG